MIYEVQPTDNILDLLRASLQFEDDRTAARETIRQEIRDRHAAVLILIDAQVNAPNHAAYELFRRASHKLEQYTDTLFDLLEVL